MTSRVESLAARWRQLARVSQMAALACWLLTEVGLSAAQGTFTPGDRAPPRPEAKGWKEPEPLLVGQAGGLGDVQIAVGTDGRVHFFRSTHFAEGGKFDLLYRHREAGPLASWSDEERVESSEAESWHPPCFATTGGSDGSVHLVWTSNRLLPGPRLGRLFHKQREGRNGSWGPTTTLAATASTMGCPSAAADSGGSLHLVWSQGDGVYYREFNRGIGAWLETLRLFMQPLSTPPSVTVAVGAQGSMHVAWTAPNRTLSYRDRDRGLPWSAVQTPVVGSTSPRSTCIAMNEEYPDHEVAPSMNVAHDGIVHLAWTQKLCLQPQDESHVFYMSRATDGNWSTSHEMSIAVPPTAVVRRSSNPSLVVATLPAAPAPPLPGAHKQSTVHIVWRERTQLRDEPFYRDRLLYRSLDAGMQTWSDATEVFIPQPVGNTYVGTSYFGFGSPSIAVDDSNGFWRGVTMHAAWSYSKHRTGAIGVTLDLTYRRNVLNPTRVIQVPTVLPAREP